MSASSEWARAAGALAAGGLDVVGVLAPDRYDGLVPEAWRCAAVLPGAKSVCVLGAGGRGLFAAFRRAPEAAEAVDPIDRYVRRLSRDCVSQLGAAGFASRALCYSERRGDAHADFVALGRASGLGAPGRLGLLLHPVYGPWLSLRALVITALPLPPTPSLVGFDPCQGCPAPCAAACHGAAFRAPDFDVGACARTRQREPACALRCDARRACVLGPEHAYAPEAESHHMRASAAAMTRRAGSD